jgi:hypothetical protein
MILLKYPVIPREKSSKAERSLREFAFVMAGKRSNSIIILSILS